MLGVCVVAAGLDRAVQSLHQFLWSAPLVLGVNGDLLHGLHGALPPGRLTAQSLFCSAGTHASETESSNPLNE